MGEQPSMWRGWPMYESPSGWRYIDTGQLVSEQPDRPCGACGLPNREDGHDACLGEIPGAINACCGHGVKSDAYVQFAADAADTQYVVLRPALCSACGKQWNAVQDTRSDGTFDDALECPRCGKMFGTSGLLGGRYEE